MEAVTNFFKPDPNTVPILYGINKSYQWFKRGDVDALPALFFDNLSSLLAIILATLFVPVIVSGFVPAVTGAHIAAFEAMIFGRVLPGIAFALAFGNIWYGWMAFKLSKFDGRDDVTALPYGINTPAGFLVAFSIMLPLCIQYSSLPPAEFAEKIWQVTASANFIGGILECLGYWLAATIRNNTSKAALYAPIAAVGFVFLALDPFVKVGGEPIVGILPFAVAFTGFFANDGHGIYPTGINSLLIFGTGTIIMWAGGLRGDGSRPGQPSALGDQLVSAYDTFAWTNDMRPGLSLAGFADAEALGQSLRIVIPVALQSFIETMENVEAASQKGDNYNLFEAMLVDGLGTMVGAFFGSTIPTTVYIGHARYKNIGAAAGYSLLNALIYVLLLLTGLFAPLFRLVDQVSILCILLVVGLMIVRQAFEVTVSRHYPCLCIGIFCLILNYFSVNAANLERGIYNIGGDGGIISSLIITQIVCDLIDLRFGRAMVYTGVAIFASLFGLMHGNNPISPQGTGQVATALTVSTVDNPNYYLGVNEGWRFSVAYSLLFVFCGAHLAAQRMGWIGEPIMDNGTDPAHMMGEHGESVHYKKEQHPTTQIA